MSVQVVRLGDVHEVQVHNDGAYIEVWDYRLYGVVEIDREIGPKLLKLLVELYPLDALSIIE